MAQFSTSGITDLLTKWRAGDNEALDTLVPVIYQELRQIAHRYLRHERPGHTLQSTALVHEAYVRLRRQSGQEFANRTHFLAIAAQLMRQILVEYARRHHAAKRNGGQALVLEDTVVLSQKRSVDLVSLDDALNELARLDARQSKRFFGGLSTEEAAGVASWFLVSGTHSVIRLPSFKRRSFASRRLTQDSFLDEGIRSQWSFSTRGGACASVATSCVTETSTGWSGECWTACIGFP